MLSEDPFEVVFVPVEGVHTSGSSVSGDGVSLSLSILLSSLSSGAAGCEGEVVHVVSDAQVVNNVQVVEGISSQIISVLLL